MDISIVSRNVMCDNVFATYVEIALQLAGADNCIVSNSHFEQTRESSEREAFIFAEEACNCWVQNSYVYYIGRHRATTKHTRNSYVRNMFDDKKHRRMFLGENFDIPNHWFKFTGCEFEAVYEILDGIDWYFYHDINNVMSGDDNPQKSQFGEYWDNCYLISDKTTACLWKMYCINDFPSGVTIRNSYISAREGTEKAAFRLCCWTESCSDENNVCEMNKYCLHAKFGKYFPWLHLENSVFEGFTNRYAYSDWQYVLATGNSFSKISDDKTRIGKAVKLSNSYGKNCFFINDKTYQPLTL